MTVTTVPLATSEAIRVIMPERAVYGKPLGRHIHHDPRSRSYPAERSPRVASVLHSSSGLPLTQADDHSCSTAHSLCAALNSSPNNEQTRRLFTEQDALSIYQRARMLDYSDVNESVPGSSALMACKAARSLGLILSYEHAFGLRHALEALALRPVMTGFAWYTSFDSPEPGTGLIEVTPDAEVRGGHEVVAHAIDAQANLVWFWNSWGPKFGLGGRFCMTFETWGRLLAEQGDVTVPIV